MKAPTIVVLILLFLSTNAAQTRRPASPKATPKVSVQTATTRDGRTVLLKSDGTWEYTDDPITPSAATPNSGAGITATNAASQSGELSLEAALVFRSGDVKPMARTVFYLLDDDLAKILRTAGLKTSQRYGAMQDTDHNLLFTFGSASKYPSLEDHAQFYSTATEALKPHIKQSITTDFSGKATFQNVPVGNYFLMGFGLTPRGFVLWNIAVEMKPGTSSITLDQNNAAFAT